MRSGGAIASAGPPSSVPVLRWSADATRRLGQKRRVDPVGAEESIRSHFFPRELEVSLLPWVPILPDLAGSDGRIDPVAAWAWGRSWSQRFAPGAATGSLLLNPVVNALLESR